MAHTQNHGIDGDRDFLAALLMMNKVNSKKYR